MALSKKSQKLVAFLTELGGFAYLRAPIGLTSSGDIFCAHTDEALVGIPGLHKLVDDLIVYGETKKQLMERVYLVMEQCRKHSITLSASKAQVGQVCWLHGRMQWNQGRSSKDQGYQELPSTERPHQSQVLLRACKSAGQVLS